MFYVWVEFCQTSTHRIALVPIVLHCFSDSLVAAATVLSGILVLPASPGFGGHDKPSRMELCSAKVYMQPPVSPAGRAVATMRLFVRGIAGETSAVEVQRPDSERLQSFCHAVCA